MSNGDQHRGWDMAAPGGSLTVETLVEVVEGGTADKPALYRITALREVDPETRRFVERMRHEHPRLFPAPRPDEELQIIGGEDDPAPVKALAPEPS